MALELETGWPFSSLMKPTTSNLFIAVIYKHPAVREAAVFGIPDSKWGELVMATVVLKPGMTLNANELTSHCRQYLANYKIPRHVEFSDTELPKSGSGK